MQIGKRNEDKEEDEEEEEEDDDDDNDDDDENKNKNKNKNNKDDDLSYHCGVPTRVIFSVKFFTRLIPKSATLQFQSLSRSTL
jgi:ABC-type Zn2+ transport system substrate-binding protein/surface adhesin